VKLNKQRAENGTLTKDQVKALGKWVRFIVKSFRYIGRSSVRSTELRFYITKLAETTGFNPRHLHEAIY